MKGETSGPPADAAPLTDDDLDWGDREPAEPKRNDPRVSERVTEAGAAERFARLHGDDARFDHRRKRWLIWQGHRFAPDTTGQITRTALGFARTWQRAAMDIPDPDRRKRAFSAAIRLEQRAALTSMLDLAADLEPIAEAGDRWDADPWLLGAPNGVINLRTGQLRDGRRQDLITMSTAVAFDSHATCPTFEQFFVDTFAGQPELMAFVHRAVGYSLTGDTTEQALFLCYGQGGNGKGTLVQTLSHALGDYAYVMPFSTVELHQRSAIPNDLAALLNKRFISASETNDGTRLNEARVKALTGCDPISARFLHAEFFTFQPVGKFWLAVNHKPIVRDDSHAFWRRLRLIPFQQTFPINKTLGAALRREAAGILAWCVQGCLEWQRHGLDAPPIVREATAAYASESDQLGDFIEQVLDRVPGSEIAASDLFSTYQRWAAEHAISERERMSNAMFGRKMGERLPSRRINGRKQYLDVARRAPW
jgi:putative DNA primase/helicase